MDKILHVHTKHNIHNTIQHIKNKNQIKMVEEKERKKWTEKGNKESKSKWGKLKIMKEKE